MEYAPITHEVVRFLKLFLDQLTCQMKKKNDETLFVWGEKTRDFHNNGNTKN